MRTMDFLIEDNPVRAAVSGHLISQDKQRWDAVKRECEKKTLVIMRGRLSLCKNVLIAQSCMFYSTCPQSFGFYDDVSRLFSR